MSAIDFIDYLVSANLVRDKVANKLKKEIERSPKRVSTRSVAKLLIKKGIIEKSEMKSIIDDYSHSKLKPADEDLELMPDDSAEEEEFEIVDDDDLVEVEEPIVTPPVPPAAPPVSTDHDPLGGDDHHDPLGSISETAASHDEFAAAATPKKSTKRKKYRANQWDSPLMLMGGGGLLLMVFLGIGLYLFMTRSTATDAIAVANDFYDSGSYAQASNEYGKFVDKFPDDDNASLAKVRIVSSRILADVNRKSWNEALQKVQTELPTVLPEEAFDQIRQDLSSILPNIMEGFAQKAEGSDSRTEAESQLALANSALAEIRNSAYLPTRFQKDLQPRLDAIDKIVKSVEWRINRDKELDVRIGEMKSAIDAGNTEEAYAIRIAMLKKFPDLQSNEQLRATVLEITKKELDGVQPLSEVPTPTTEDHASQVQLAVVLASTKSSSTIQSLSGHVVFFLVRGSVYALDASNGNVLWRRFVGFESTIQPVATSREANRDAIVVDGQRNELLRLEGKTGKLLWRLPCPGPISRPVLDGNRVFVGSATADQNGLLLAVDVESGEVQKGASFPGVVPSPPLIDRQQGLVFQPGEQSSLFVLDANDLSCKDVVYLGHRSKNIVIAPIMVMDFLVVAENPGPKFSMLHVLAPNSENEGRLSVVDKIRLNGQVVVPLQKFGKRFLAATDRGSVDVFEADNRNLEKPIKKAVQGIVAPQQKSVTYQRFYRDGRLWLASTQLTRYDLQTTRGTFTQKWIRNRGDIFTTPMQDLENTLFHVRLKKGKLGATISAIQVSNANNDGSELWQTDVAVPPAGEVFINSTERTVNVISANGALFSLGGSDLQKSVIDTPQFALADPSIPALTGSVVDSNGKRVYFGERSGSTCVVYDPAKGSKLEVVRMEIGNGTIASIPVLFGNELLVPTVEGAVYLIDPSTGAPAAHEFQPPLGSGTKMMWARPVVDPATKEAVLSDGSNKLHRVTLQEQPQPHLQSIAQSEIDLVLTGQLALCDETIYAIQKGIGADDVVAIDAGNLTSSSKKWTLDGRVSWGPDRIGDIVIVTSENDEMICLDGQQNQKWKIKLPNGPLAGRPSTDGTTLLIASVRGNISLVNLENGEITPVADIGKPLGTGPVKFGSRIIVLGSDGAIYVLGAPAG